MRKFLYIPAFLFFLYSCSDNSVNNTGTFSQEYYKILEVSNDTVKYELYSATGNQLYYAYNDLGIKVFLHGVEQTYGYVRYAPRMTHFIGARAHGTPVKPIFNYNPQKSMFTGYASYIMVSDTFSYWLGDYSFNGQYRIQDTLFFVHPNPSHRLSAWPNLQDGYIYYLSLIFPFSPVKGMNEIRMVLNRSYNDTLFSEVDSCEMFIRTFVSATGQSSNGHMNPFWIGGGMYKGYVNLPFSALWSVYDSIIFRGITKTNSPPAELILSVP